MPGGTVLRRQLRNDCHLFSSLWRRPGPVGGAGEGMRSASGDYSKSCPGNYTFAATRNAFIFFFFLLPSLVFKLSSSVIETSRSCPLFWVRRTSESNVTTSSRAAKHSNGVNGAQNPHLHVKCGNRGAEKWGLKAKQGKEERFCCSWFFLIDACLIRFQCNELNFINQIIFGAVIFLLPRKKTQS